VLAKLRRLIEHLAPWYDPEREAVRDQRTNDVVERANRTANALRQSYRQAEDRLSRPR
jgi:hypothetical protein